MIAKQMIAKRLYRLRDELGVHQSAFARFDCQIIFPRWSAPLLDAHSHLMNFVLPITRVSCEWQIGIFKVR